jgi:hypothetical protein
VLPALYEIDVRDNLPELSPSQEEEDAIRRWETAGEEIAVKHTPGEEPAGEETAGEEDRETLSTVADGAVEEEATAAAATTRKPGRRRLWYTPMQQQPSAAGAGAGAVTGTAAGAIAAAAAAAAAAPLHRSGPMVAPARLGPGVQPSLASQLAPHGQSIYPHASRESCNYLIHVWCFREVYSNHVFDYQDRLQTAKHNIILENGGRNATRRIGTSVLRDRLASLFGATRQPTMRFLQLFGQNRSNIGLNSL